MNDNTFTVKQGEKQPHYIRLYNADEGKPIDLTNATIKLTIRDELEDQFSTIEKIITSETDVYSVGRILDPSKGEVIFRFTDDDYSKLVVERVYYMTIYWIVDDEYFSKVVSSNGCEMLKFKVCYA